LVLLCDTMSSGPPGAWLRIGSSTSAQARVVRAEHRTSSALAACWWAFAVQRAASQLPVEAFASSYCFRVTAYRPARPFTWSR